MPEAAAFRVDLLTSRRARRVLALARTLTAGAVVAGLWALLLAPSAPRALAAGLSIAVLALALRPAGPAAARRLAVDADGTIRAGTGDADEAAVVRYSGRHFVCLEAGGRLLAVWPDALGPAHWRRLQVACRWQRPLPGAGTPGSSGLRTK